ncbi:MAG: hypothetical protein A3F10_05280 [Coxiella sp. RIFCSPHIGHO2_12_FULL_42_15]|nr:MAG: hypothetical protein A3F10_05280 [Coxiella sp. RIFCSPHIGHO2_12_FULL_42_15]
MARFLLIIVLLMSLLFSVVSEALTEATQVTTVSVIVNDRSKEAFQQAVATAYAQVMVKLSGNPAIMTIPAIQNTLRSANHYLVSYRYKVKSDDQQPPALYLQMVFDQRTLQHLLQKTGQPVWNSERPETLVMFVAPQLSGDLQMLASGESGLAQSLNHVAKQHGLPIMLPLLDIEDQLVLADKPLDALSATEVQQFSARYHAQHVLVAVLNETQIHWKFYSKGSATEWTTNDKDLQLSLIAGFDRLLEELASHYALVKAPNLQNTVLLEVTGVHDLDEYLQVVHTLEHLTPVSRVILKNMTVDRLLFEVDTTGSEDALRRALQSSEQFASSKEDEAQALQYQWQAR